ncbi:MAG: hypothetical protein SX243_00235 [Acidobacteriota bacterium]|nr:hypothetical protein [Acidobacteriota bacterium]
MPQVTIVYGLALIALGLIGYFATGGISITALIPAFFGIPVLIAGWIARRESLLKHAMHAAAMIALLGFLGTVSGLWALVTGGAPDAATLSRATMAVLSAIFVALCVRSFIQVRREREAGN